MKNEVFLKQKWQIVLILSIVSGLFASSLAAQVVSSSLSAINLNGKVAIRANNFTSFTNYFSLTNGGVDLDLYFALDDPRNGVYVGSPMPQPNGQIYIRFDSLNCLEGDSLTFIAKEVLQGATTKYYVFVRGDFFPESGGPINTCPRYFSCKGKALLLHFDPQEIVLDPSSATPITLEIPSINLDVVRIPGAISPADNALVFKFLPVIDCSQVMLGTATFTINGITCHFVNGQLTCPPWANIPNDLGNNCAPYFDNCLTELVDLISDAQYSLPCQQWFTYGNCTTTNIITRPGKIAIGTQGFAPNAVLTVKNGVITDKLKLSNIGWADFVFDENYELMPINEVESYIAKYQHLPNMPSGKELETIGSFELGHTTIKHQEHIEKIFLYLIELEEETQRLESVLFLQETLYKIRFKK
jgi:hypothetical protein